MFSVFRNAWKVQDLRKKILFTALVLIIFRLGCNIPVPFLDPDALKAMFGNFASEGNIFTYLNILSGDAMSSASFFSLSISPYINASIIVQLLTVAIPKMQE